MGWPGSLVAGQSTKARRHWRRFAGDLVIRFWRRRFADAGQAFRRLGGDHQSCRALDHDDFGSPESARSSTRAAICAPTRAEACRKCRPARRAGESDTVNDEKSFAPGPAARGFMSGIEFLSLPARYRRPADDCGSRRRELETTSYSLRHGVSSGAAIPTMRSERLKRWAKASRKENGRSERPWRNRSRSGLFLRKSRDVLFSIGVRIES